MYKFGSLSESRLVGVKPALVAVVRRALELSTVDFAVVEGLRTPQRQRELYAQGRETPGKIVTWTLLSKHILGEAVDLAPWVGGKIDWMNSSNFGQIAVAMFAAADELDVKVRWGKDWNQNGVPGEKGEADSPHWELA